MCRTGEGGVGVPPSSTQVRGVGCRDDDGRTLDSGPGGLTSVGPVEVVRKPL